MNEFFSSDFFTQLLYVAVTFAVLFLKSFLDKVKPGKPDKLSQRVVLGFIRKFLNYLSPEELGTKAALKVNPDSPNARRISDNKRFTKKDALHFNSGVLGVRDNFQTGAGKGGEDDWDFV